MNSQAISVERRKHLRDGVVGQLEDITYSVLRKYGVIGQAGRQAEMMVPTAAQLRRKEGTTMGSNLMVIVSNEQPNREKSYPQTWLLYRRGQDTLELHVGHDSPHRPYVLDKRAA